MITLTLSDAAELRDQLRNLASHQLPGDIKFKIYENINELDDTVKSYLETRNDLIKEYGEPFRGQMVVREYIGEKGDQINPKAADFMKQKDKLEETTKEFDLYMLPLSIFSTERELVGDMYAIFRFCTEKPSKPAKASTPE